MTTLMLTLINMVTVMVNVGLLAVFIKLYSEVLKIRHIQNIGKKEKTDPDAVVR